MTLGLLATSGKADATAEPKELDRLTAALERIRDNFVDTLDQSDLVDAAIKGMLGLLDTQSEYLDGKFFRDMQIVHGCRGGLGIESVVQNGALKVVASLDDSPAAKAGIRSNDIISHIDGISLQGLPSHRARDKLLCGPVNTKVSLTIIRSNPDKPIELTVVREVISVRSVRMRQDGDDIGYIRITSINETTMRALREAIRELFPPDKLKGYVLDLRNTPSGLLDVAVSLADEFLEIGEIVSIRGSNPEKVEHFNASPGDIVNGKPLVILINGGTASVAEMVAGALQDHKRATLVGSRTFGRGLVQTIIPLGGPNGALRLTTGRYITPAGRSFDGAGIVPDIEVLQDFPTNPQDDKALTVAHELLRGNSNPKG